MTTELTLREWRFGQTQAERLCAGVLSIEGFSAVDPQHPLGGPDGLKDVLCRRGMTTFVAAAYFPTTAVSFSTIQSKFDADLEGVKKNDARGFVFIVNQALTVGERQTLHDLAEAKSESTELYHLERLRSVLDSPRGCGLRLEYLGIPMTHEEQIAYWSSANIDLAARLDRIEALQLRTLHQVTDSEEEILRRTSAMFLGLRSDRSSTLDRPSLAGGVWRSGPATVGLNLPILLWMHRLLLAQSRLPPALVGTLRTISVTVESADGSPTPYTPPPPEELPDLVRDWCEAWGTGYDDLRARDPDGRLDGITRAYYEFMRIHPFTDGNGRMGRALLDQMLRELLATSLPASFYEARIEHQAALQQADLGDLDPLRRLIAAAIS